MKNKLPTYLLIFFVILIGIFTGSIILILSSSLGEVVKYSIIILISFMFFLVFIFTSVATYSVKRKRETIKKSFDSYIEESVSQAGVGLIILNSDSDIIWISKFIEERLGRKVIGRKLFSLSKVIEKKFNEGQTKFLLPIDEIVFSAQVDYENQTIILKDITNEDMILRQYINEKVAVAELEIDNFTQFQSILPEEEIFKVQSSVIKMLDDLSEQYNLVYRQYVNGKFLIYTNQNALNELVQQKFKFLDKIRGVNVIDGINLSASIGVGTGSSQIKELLELAKDGLSQALARGGDQVAVMESNKKPEYFGSKTEAVQSSSRVKIKQISKLIEDKLSSAKIKKVIIYGHVYADLDAVGSAMGVAHLAKEYKKEVYIQNATFDSTTRNTIEKFFTKEEREFFIKKTKANRIATKKDTMVIIVDTAEMARIENEKALTSVELENVFIFDHHRVSKLPDDIPTTNTYIDTTASSASEIISEVLQFISKNIKPPRKIAQMLLNGIYLDTNQFTKSTSSRTFIAAGWLERFGASSKISTEILKLPEEYAMLVAEVLSGVREIKPGYFLSSYQGDVPQDIISLATDEILRVQGRKAAFVIAKLPGSGDFKMSARGIETNVQVIAEAVGGGGHFGAAAAVSKEPLSVFTDNVIQSIVSIKGGDDESNNN